MAAEGKYEHQMTLAELCGAIEEGSLPYILSDGEYEVRAADVRRLRSLGRPRLTLPDPAEMPAGLLDQPGMGQLDFGA